MRNARNFVFLIVIFELYHILDWLCIVILFFWLNMNCNIHYGEVSYILRDIKYWKFWGVDYMYLKFQIVITDLYDYVFVCVLV